MQASVKKVSGIEGILIGYSPEAEEKLPLNASDILSDVVRKYELYLDEAEYLEQVTEVLSSGQINAVLQTSVRYEDHPQNMYKTGSFISQLIQNSYDAGHNDFKLSTTGLTLHSNIGFGLKGTEERPLAVTIEGDVGDCCGKDAEHATFNINGIARYFCGMNSKDSHFIINGNVGVHCGKSAKHSTFTISGSEVKLLYLMNCVHEGNRVVFVHPNGKEEVIRDYHDKR